MNRSSKSSVLKRSHRRGSIRYRRLILSALIAGLISCAEVAPPPGGEADKLRPVLMGSVPADRATEVAPDRVIKLFFSERVVSPRTGKAVFISPRPLQEPRLRWKSDRLEIFLPDTFRTDETYIVSLSADITDLRGNKLDSSVMIAFSTGAFIDSGTVSGRVFAADKPRGGLMVGLYRATVFDDTATILDSLYPDYLTRSNQEGAFTFQYLPSREYRLVAFEDKNRDERFNPSRESFALPDRPIVPGGKVPVDNLELMLTSQDTVTTEIISAAFIAEGLLKIRMSRSIELGILCQNPSNLLLSSQTDSGQVIVAGSFPECDLEETSILHALFDSLPEGVYDLELMFDLSQSAITYAGIKSTVADDQKPPTIERFYPDPSPQFVEDVELQLVFSEPLDTAGLTDEAFVLQDGKEQNIPLTLKWRDPFHLLLQPSELNEGTSYTLTVAEFEIADAAGNMLGDTLKQYSFSTLNSSTLGSISGEVVIAIEGQQDSPAMLSFKKVGSSRTFDLSVTDRTFAIDVPSGKYLLSGFVDSDLDGVRGVGSISPFRLAETSASYPDTISVRSRFETAGIRFEIR